jgi:hypothetical protein
MAGWMDRWKDVRLLLCTVTLPIIYFLQLATWQFFQLLHFLTLLSFMALPVYFLFFNVRVLLCQYNTLCDLKLSQKCMQWSLQMQSAVHCFMIISVTIIRDSMKWPQPSINILLGINATCCHVAHHVNPWLLETDIFSRLLDTISISTRIIIHKHFARQYLSVEHAITCPFIFCTKTNKVSILKSLQSSASVFRLVEFGPGVVLLGLQTPRASTNSGHPWQILWTLRKHNYLLNFFSFVAII